MKTPVNDIDPISVPKLPKPPFERYKIKAAIEIFQIHVSFVSGEKNMLRVCDSLFRNCAAEKTACHCLDGSCMMNLSHNSCAAETTGCLLVWHTPVTIVLIGLTFDDVI